MRQTTLEPGLLAVFRLFTGLWLALMLPTTVIHLVFRGPPPFMRLRLLEFIDHQRVGGTSGQFPYWALFNFAMAILIVGYLWWPALPRWLGRWYLPIGLTIASVGPIIGQHLRVIWFGASEASVLAGAWQLVLVLFLPLVLIAWQYNFRTVLAYSLGVALFDIGLTILTVGWDTLHTLPFLGIVFIRTVSYIVVGYMVSQLVKAQRKQRQELAEANTRLTHYATTLEQLSISRERNRLARELHDTLAHTLSGVTVQLEAVEALWETDPAAAHTLLDQSLVTTRTGLTETRRALQALRASPLEDLGLVLAVRHLAESLAARTGLTLDLQLPEKLADLTPTVEQCIYRVAQEALANVDRHASANNLSVQLERENQHLTLTVADDGCGFARDQARADRQFGLQGMKERAEMLGGSFEVHSQLGQGTRLRLRVPLNAEATARETANDPGLNL